MNKKRLIILALITISLTVIGPAWAQSPSNTPTPNPEEVVDPEGNTPERNQIEKIKEIRDAVKEKVRETIEEVGQGKLIAYVGTISQLDKPNFSLETRKGDKTVQTSQETKFIGSGREEIEFSDLEENDYLIVIGYLTGGVLDARRVIVSSKPKPIIRELAFGKVTDISTEEELLTVKNSRKQMTYTITTSSKTVITKKVDGKVEKIDFEEIEINDRILAIVTASENEEKMITAKIIHVIPGKATGQQTSPTPTE